jgi:tetratricopeptide (TPR) repeat protein
MLVCAFDGELAWAKSEEPSAAEIQVARRLFRQATEDEAAGRWQEALGKLREIENIKVTPGVLFHIAVCQQNLGRYVEALNDLGRAEELARAKGDQGGLDFVPERRQEL